MKFGQWQIKLGIGTARGKVIKTGHWDVHFVVGKKIKVVGYYSKKEGYPVLIPLPPELLSEEMIDELAEFVRWVDEQCNMHKPRQIVIANKKDPTHPTRLKTPEKSTFKQEDIDGHPREDDGVAEKPWY